MSIRKRDKEAGEAVREETERERLANELADLKSEVRALRTERDSTGQLAKLRRDIETLRIEKGRLTEDNAREIREVEHKTGLLRVQQEHEIANAKRETGLAVREENLAADKKRFAGEMTFQREHLQREVDRIEGILGKILERLPVIDVALSGGARSAAARKAEG